MKKVELNHIQKTFLIDSLIEESSKYNAGYTFLLKGDFAVSKFIDSLYQLFKGNSLFHAKIRHNTLDDFYWEIDDNFKLPITQIKLKKNETKDDIISTIDFFVREKFDLKNDYPCRFALLQTSDNTFFFILVIHHILYDADSINLFTKYLSNIYNGVASKYIDISHYIEWEKSHYDSDKTRTGLNYWNNYISSDSSFILKPLWYDAYEKGYSIKISLDEQIKNQCTSFCDTHKTSIFRFLLNVWSITLTKFFHTNSILINYAVNICPPEFKNTIGNFTNNLLMLIAKDKHTTFRSLLEQISKERHKAREFQHIPLLGTSMSKYLRNSIFTKEIRSIGFNYPTRKRQQHLNLFGCVSSLYRETPLDLPNDILLEFDDFLVGHLQTSHIPYYIAQNLANSFLCILEQSLNNPDLEIDRMSLIRKENNILQNLFHPAFQKETLVDVFKDTVYNNLSKVAIRHKNEELTFQEIDIISEKVAYCLQQKNISSGSSIGLYMERSVWILPTIIGIWKTGMCYVPLDIEYPEERLNHIIKDSNIPLCITNLDINNLACKSINIEEIKNIETGISQINKQDKKSDAYIIYTSGTTGVPKGVKIKQSSLLNLIFARQQYIPIEKNPRELCFSRISFDGSVWEIFPTLLTGGTIFMASEEERHDTRLLTNLIKEQSITCAYIPPSLLAIIPPTPFPDLNFLVIAGESCNPEIIQKWQDVTQIVNSYGPTENTVCATISLLNKESHPNDIGVPLSGVSCYILDDCNHLVPDGVEGELCIGGMQLTSGYLNCTEVNRDKFIENPFASEEDKSKGINTRLYKSGDLAMRLPNGHFIFIGRKDNQVKIHGYRIELGEIEQVLNKFPQINQSKVILQEKDEKKILVAYLQTNNDTIKSTSLRSHLNKFLPSYMIPSFFVPLKQFPLTANGKIDTKRLSKIQSAIEIHDELELPQTDIEKEISLIWKQLIGEHISINRTSNFFELGGDSLQIMQMAMLIENKYRIPVKVSEVVLHIHLNELAQYIEQLISKGTNQKLQTLKNLTHDIKIKLAPSQKSLWLQCQYSPESTKAYNVPLFLSIEGIFNADAMEKAFNSVLERQEALRMHFPLDEKGEPFIDIEPYHYQSILKRQIMPQFLEQNIHDLLQTIMSLENGPLYKFEIWNIDNQHTVIAFVLHHLISDGLSCQIFFKQLTDVYQALCEQRNVSISFFNYQYTNYAYLQNEVLSTPEYQEKQTFWKQYLTGCNDLNLPVHSFSYNFEGNALRFSLSQRLSQDIQSFCKLHGITPFIFFLAAYQLLLIRYTGQYDFVIGTPVSAREKKEFENLIGYFVQVIPIRSEITDDKDTHSFVEYIQKLQLRFLHIIGQSLSFDKILSTCDNRASFQHDFPLIQAIFSFVDYEMQQTTDTYTIRSLETKRDISTFPLLLEVLPLTNGFTCQFVYMKNLFTDDRIQQLGEIFQDLLFNILEYKDDPILQIPLIPKEKQQKYILRENIKSGIKGYTETIPSSFFRIAKEYPEKIAVKCAGETLCYQQLDKLSDTVAQALISHFKQKKTTLSLGQRVALYSERNCYTIVAIMGILKAGCSYVPLETTYPKERINFILQDCQAPLILCNGVQKEFLASETCNLQDLLAYDGQEQLPSFDGNAEMYVIYTSGTTGTPKGVPILHKNLLNFIEDRRILFNDSSTMNELCFFNLAFDGSVWGIFPPLLNGGTLYLCTEKERQDPLLLLNAFTQEKITHAILPPAMLSLLPPTSLPELRYLIVGGDSSNPEILNRWKHQTTLVNAYGPTENTICTSMCFMDASTPANDIGPALSGVSCYVLDEYLNLVPDGMEGELYIGGLQLTQGYINRPELNKEKFIINPFASEEDKARGINIRLYKSGDRVKRMPNGHFLFSGRMDNQVKLRGYRIELGEIETLLTHYPNVEQVLITTFGKGEDKQLAAYLRTKSNIAINDLRFYLAESLPSYMIPTLWCFLESFPLTVNGKIDYKKLPEPIAYATEKYIEPASIPEKTLADIARSLLRVDKVSVCANLFDLGLTSIQAMAMAFEARQNGMEISVSAIYKDKNIRKILAGGPSSCCYWGNKYQEDKPILLIVCGYPYYRPVYDEFAKVMSSQFSLLVLESFNEYFIGRSTCSYAELLATSVDMIRPYIEGKRLFGVTGLCLGGEIAMQIAVELEQQHLAQPQVFVIDGFAKRDGSSPDSLYFNEPGISEALNRERNHIKDQLLHTRFFRPYKGDVHVYLAQHFSAETPIGEVLPENVTQSAYEGFLRNASEWEESQPRCDIRHIDATHWTILLRSAAETMLRFMLETKN